MKTPVFFIILIFSALSEEVDIFLDVVSDIMTEFTIKCATFIQDDIRKSELKEMIINSKAQIKITNLQNRHIFHELQASDNCGVFYQV